MQGLLFPEFVPGVESGTDPSDAALSTWLDGWIAACPASSLESDLALGRVETPLGPMVAAATAGSLALLEFAEPKRLESQLRAASRRSKAAITRSADGDPHVAVLKETQRQIAEYFAHERRDFDLPLGAAGTPFQREVWRELCAIPFGARRSYGEIATAVGRPSASRAVGSANGLNPLAILQPCHRVIGADGTLTGYGGGLWRKLRLLEIESDCPLPSPG